jgi:tellurite resistance protein TerC
MSAFFASTVFTLVVLGLVAMDLGIFHRPPHATSIREGAVWSAIWIALSLAFNLGIYFWRGPEPALQFLTGYVLEKALSMDNVFVFSVVLISAAVPAAFHHRVLFWGILGAIITRGLFVVAGAALISHFHWALYVFGAFLVFTGVRVFFEKKLDVHPDRNPVLRLSRRLLATTERYEGPAFFVRRGGRILATPLFFVLVMVETVDILFAIDSIPAIFAVTDDPFIVYASNICAVLGLRALYFVLSGAVVRFRYLRVGLSAVLVLVGAKMLLASVYRISTLLSLGVIAAIVAVAIGASFLAERRERVEVHTRQT